MASPSPVTREYGAIVTDFPSQGLTSENLHTAQRLADAAARAALKPSTRYHVLLTFQGPQGWYGLVAWYSCTDMAHEATWEDTLTDLAIPLPWPPWPPWPPPGRTVVLARRTTPEEPAHG